MMPAPPRFDGMAAMVDARLYQPFARESIERATTRVWVCMFICDIRPGRDVAGLVLDLLLALEARRRLGVDVRVLLASTTRTADIETANLASGIFLSERGVPLRRIFADEIDPEAALPPERLGSHAKFAIFDDLALVGSANWTDDAFRENFEETVALTGGGVDLLCAEFLRLWRNGRGMPRHAA